MAGAFGLGCLVGVALGVGESLRSFHWGFVTLGTGFLLSAFGLGVGGLGVVWSLVADTKPAAPGAAARRQQSLRVLPAPETAPHRVMDQAGIP